MTEWTGMSLEELQYRLRMGRSLRGSHSPYIVSYDTYKRMGDAVAHFVSTGELPPHPESTDAP